jgi:putative pyruvate formate lyase activating enzyme
LKAITRRQFMTEIPEIQSDIFTREERELLADCTLCPRECHADRFKGSTGYCRSDAGMNIASICIHTGEEPPVSGPEGICNIFFSGCNLRCIYCQNFEISRPGISPEIDPLRFADALDKITCILDSGIKAVGFVSPSHVIPQVKAIVRGLHERGYRPVTVYNTNGYDKRETIIGLNGMIDVYLPDFKYVTPGISFKYSDAPDYPEVAFTAIKEMYFQKGSSLHTDGMGRAESGLFLRHLVLPGHAEESRRVLRKIAEELSTGVHISLMSQYHPIPSVRDHRLLNRPLYKEEYDSVVREMEELGFRKGWLQDMDSFQNYRPDFSSDSPFG